MLKHYSQIGELFLQLAAPLLVSLLGASVVLLWCRITRDRVKVFELVISIVAFSFLAARKAVYQRANDDEQNNSSYDAANEGAVDSSLLDHYRRTYCSTTIYLHLGILFAQIIVEEIVEWIGLNLGHLTACDAACILRFSRDQLGLLDVVDVEWAGVAEIVRITFRQLSIVLSVAADATDLDVHLLQTHEHDVLAEYRKARPVLWYIAQLRHEGIKVVDNGRRGILLVVDYRNAADLVRVQARRAILVPIAVVNVVVDDAIERHDFSLHLHLGAEVVSILHANDHTDRLLEIQRVVDIDLASVLGATFSCQTLAIGEGHGGILAVDDE